MGKLSLDALRERAEATVSTELMNNIVGGNQLPVPPKYTLPPTVLLPPPTMSPTPTPDPPTGSGPGVIIRPVIITPAVGNPIIGVGATISL